MSKNIWLKSTFYKIYHKLLMSNNEDSGTIHFAEMPKNNNPLLITWSGVLGPIDKINYLLICKDEQRIMMVSIHKIID